MIGECFFYDTPPNGQHLFVVLAPSLTQKGWFICTNITEKQAGSDSSCELLLGEHPNLTKPVSVMNYHLTRELPLPLIQRHTQNQRLPRMDAQVLRRIHEAALSDGSRMKKDFQNAVREHLGRAS